MTDEIEKVLKQMERKQGKAARSKSLTFRLLAQKNIADGASKANPEKFLQQCATATTCALNRAATNRTTERIHGKNKTTVN